MHETSSRTKNMKMCDVCIENIGEENIKKL